MELADDFLERAIVARFSAIVKARPMDTTGRRIVETEASTEETDDEGDVVLQSALMGSANSFVGNGHLDIDHMSEFGERLGIPNPSSFIVGRPMAVEARAGGRTFVKGEIMRSPDGRFDPEANRYDSFWETLQRDPPVKWMASIYGFPTDLDDCRGGACSAGGATRWLVKAIDWRSLAFTRNPRNTAISSPARIVTAKAYMAEMAKNAGAPPLIPMPGSMGDVWKSRACENCGADKAPSLAGYRDHFAKCAGHPPGTADLLAHAVMYKHELVRRVPALAANRTG